MISTLVTFLFATLISGLCTYVYTRARWQKKLKATRQALYDQHRLALEEMSDRTRLLEACERKSLAQKSQLAEEKNRLIGENSQLVEEKRRLTEEAVELNKQLASRRHDLRQAQSDYETHLLEMESDRAVLLQANEGIKADWKENVDLVLKQNVAIEASSGALKDKVTQLTLDKEQLQLTLKAQATQHEDALKTAYREPNIDIGSLIKELFPSLEMMRDSVDEISRNKRDIIAILHRLQALENKTFDHSKKVRSTGGEWSECKAPYMKMIRLYYRKESASPSHKCEVLISRKKNDKSQARDLAWLRQQPSKR